MPDTESNSRFVFFRRSAVAYSVYLIVISAILMIGGYFIVGLLQDMADSPEISTEPAGFVALLLRHWAVFPLMMTPALLCGLTGVLMKAGRKTILALGTVLLFVPPILLITAFVRIIGQLYQSSSL